MECLQLKKAVTEIRMKIEELTTFEHENSERDENTRPSDLPLEKSVCRSGSNSQDWTWNKTGSKQEKEYVKAVYCHPAYLTSMQSTL